MEKMIESLRIKVTNVSYNVYELWSKDSFWSGAKYFLRIHQRNSQETVEKQITQDDWNIIKYNIELINKFVFTGLSRKMLDYIRSNAFHKIAKYFTGAIINSQIIEPCPKNLSFQYEKDNCNRSYDRSYFFEGTTRLSGISASIYGSDIYVKTIEYYTGQQQGTVHFCDANFVLGLQKYWGLILWKRYNNRYHEKGIRPFFIDNESPSYISIPGYSGFSAPSDYHWKWLDDYDLIH